MERSRLREKKTWDRRVSPLNGRRILFATDGSDCASRAASFLATVVAEGSEVRLITVLSFEFYPYSFWGPPLSDEELRISKVRRLESDAFEHARKLLEQAGAKVSSSHRFGRVPEEILEEANAWGADLIVVGRQGLTGPSRWMLGSVSQYLVAHARVPLLIVP